MSQYANRKSESLARAALGLLQTRSSWKHDVLMNTLERKGYVVDNLEKLLSNSPEVRVQRNGEYSIVYYYEPLEPVENIDREELLSLIGQEAQWELGALNVALYKKGYSTAGLKQLLSQDPEILTRPGRNNSQLFIASARNQPPPVPVTVTTETSRKRTRTDQTDEPQPKRSRRYLDLIARTDTREFNYPRLVSYMRTKSSTAFARTFEELFLKLDASSERLALIFRTYFILLSPEEYDAIHMEEAIGQIAQYYYHDGNLMILVVKQSEHHGPSYEDKILQNFNAWLTRELMPNQEMQDSLQTKFCSGEYIINFLSLRSLLASIIRVRDGVPSQPMRMLEQSIHPFIALFLALCNDQSMLKQLMNITVEEMVNFKKEVAGLNQYTNPGVGAVSESVAYKVFISCKDFLSSERSPSPVVQ